MLCLDCTFGVLVEVSSVTRSFLCLYLHRAVMFTVLFGVSSGGQSFRLSSLVGEVWVVSYYLLFLRTAVLVVIGLGAVVCSGVCVLLEIILGCSLLFLYSLADGGFSWCCCSVHLQCKCTDASRVELLVSNRVCPRVADRGMLARYGGFRGK